jgi:hypothetical protein
MVASLVYSVSGFAKKQHHDQGTISRLLLALLCLTLHMSLQDTTIAAFIKEGACMDKRIVIK